MLDKKLLNVPNFVEHISDWVDYRIPNGHCIVDKTICGCGYTEFCFKTTDNVILCSPRVILLRDKYKQHRNESNVYYYVSDQLKCLFEDDFKAKGNRIPAKGIKLSEEEIKNYNQERFRFTANFLRSHYCNCKLMHIPCKIMVTYDSFHVIKESLREVLPDFKVVVDEFQSIFLDVLFRSDIENDFLDILRDVPNVTYLSATPILDKYIEQIPEFSNLPYQKLIWPNNRVTRAKVRECWVSDVYSEILNIIDIYRNRPLDRPFKRINGKIVFPEEVVIYANSVDMIGRIITRAKLMPSECNIVCARTRENEKKVKEFRKLSLQGTDSFEIGEIPGDDNIHKLFTFCTRAAYLGADFKQKSAITYVVSDANVQSLVVDVRLDLPQILGRQRLLENPWKNECTVFYKTLSDDKVITKEDFDQNFKSKLKRSIGVLQDQEKGLSPGTIDLCKKGLIKGASNKIKGQVEYFLGISRDGHVAYNKLLELAEKRAWELSQLDYSSDFSVTASIADVDSMSVEKYTPIEDEQVQRFISDLKEVKKFDEKLRFYCEFREGTKNNDRLTRRLLTYYQGTDLENFYSVFGYDRCHSMGYRSDRLKSMLSDEIHKDQLSSVIYGIFKLKETYSLQSIKEILRQVYVSCGIGRTPKASDLKEYFNVLERQVTDQVTKKRASSYQLVSIKGSGEPLK